MCKALPVVQLNRFLEKMDGSKEDIGRKYYTETVNNIRNIRNLKMRSQLHHTDNNICSTCSGVCLFVFFFTILLV
ncbi:hypothetical protein T4C_8325 [Trichinella pseudospiralis]|uniref:Uncharacterized protein n=1 Tax=Trichinella pseudospiralis TaxID=6337 RepID=A0A0V1K4T6_TRIPS|nr:hypothetical protein T4C_8325 [Trichinella pseudospiralis]